MKKILRSISIVFVLSVYATFVWAQGNTTSIKKVYKLPKLDEHSIVKDSSGRRYDYTAWNNMVSSGRYSVKVAVLSDGKPSLVIGKLSKAEREEALAKLPKPSESLYFKTGEALKRFKAQDVNNQLFDLKELSGKVVVLSFWQLNHMATMQEIPNLNELADTYKNDPNVVFLAVPADDPNDVKEFLANTIFKYHVIDNGKSISSKFNIETYPTSVVIDKTGKVQFHSSGYAPANSYWIAKTIEQCKTL
jgi:peroxiredoxin